MSALRVDVPAKLEPLLKPSRYKGAHGGRGGAKSHFFAEQMVLQCYASSKRCVCIREVQESIKDSVKTLIEQKIQKFGLGKFFQVLETEVRGLNGSLIIFRGMQSYNAENIKSLEAFDIAWVEEAQTLSAVSWRMLRPTIRKEGSEIWCSWNPRHDTDAVDMFFRGATKSPDAVTVEINWPDNPWFPDVLRKEKDHDYATDAEMADHVWGGNYQIVSEGAYYAKLIVQAEREGRVGHFPYNPKLPVHTSWDIGVDDYTAVWFVQEDGVSATVLDYYEASGEGADDVASIMFPEIFIPNPQDERFAFWDREAKLIEIGRDVPFKYGSHFFPHDIKIREWGAGARSRIETVKQLGFKDVRKGAMGGPEERHNATRRILPMTRFNNTPRVQLGLKRLRRYSRKMNDTLGTYTTPLKDGNDHGADAFGEFAVNCRIQPAKPPVPVVKNHHVLQVNEQGRLTSNMSVMEIVQMRKRKREQNG